MSEEKNYEYLGIQALPPRKKGRDRRRLNKNLNIPLEDDEKKEMESTVAEVVDDPFSPYVEEFSLFVYFTYRFAHVTIPDGITYSAECELQFEFLDNTADIQVHACTYYCIQIMNRGIVFRRSC